ncbi:MAG: response regulator [Spirochaetes bacterium]|nr:response regulator [Spirochaetota bacterium]
MGLQVLIVDDSASMRQMVNFTLADYGYDVVEADSGVSALKYISGRAPNLVITDINMPEMSGIELIKNIRQNARSKFLPIIVLSTEAEKGMGVEGTSAGATAWLVKPFTPDKLKETVKKVIGT